MKIEIYFVLCVFLFGCGGGSSQVNTKRDVDRQDVNTDIDNLPYPGFYEVDSKDKSNLKKSDFDYRDGYFDRHESTLRRDQTFYMDVVTREVLQDFEAFNESSSSSEVAYSYSVDIKRGINVEADYGTSELFLLSGTTNYIDVIISWDVNEKPEEINEHKFFICNPDNPNEKLYDDVYILSDEDWSVQKNKASMSYSVPIREPGKYGLCRQYKDYEVVVYDVLEVKEYDGAEFNVSVVNIGAEQLKVDDIKNNQDYFYKAGVTLNLEKSKTYDTPENFTEDGYKWSQYIPNRDDYLFVRGPFENDESDHKCYQYIKDDITLMSYKIKQEVESNLLEKRIAILYNKKHVRFWTFYLDEEMNMIFPCYEEMASNVGAKPSAKKKYKVAVLNASSGNCNFVAPDVNYDNMYIINENNTWNAYSGGKTYSLNDFTEIFDPRCHVFLDMDEYFNLHEKGAHYLKSVITGSAEGITDEFTIGLNSSPVGLWSHNDPNKGMRTFMHELGHVLGLVDVIDNGEKMKNLMHYQDLKKENGYPDPIYLNNKPMNVKQYSKWNNLRWGTKEKQWDCLNNVSPSVNCALQGHRNLSF